MANKKAKLEREQQFLQTQNLLRENLRGSDQRSAKAVVTPEVIGGLVAEHFKDHPVLRGPETFNRSIKTRDHDRIALAYALHMFTDYKVPDHVQQVILTSGLGTQLVKEAGLNREPQGYQNDWRHRNHGRNANTNIAIRGAALKEQLRAFFIVGQGGSLYKELLKEKLSKKEVHAFLTCPYDVSYAEALVYAMAKSFTDNNGVALRLAKTRFAQGNFPGFTIGHPFFRETVRFFAQYDVSLKDINDLSDYIFRRAILDAEGRYNNQWTYRGRTLQSLQKQMKDWHYELRRMAAIGGGNWSGLPIPNAMYKKMQTRCRTTNRDIFVDWKIEQILTGNDLAKEGTAMHHCVSSYKHSCVRGTTGIFSLKCSTHQADSWSRHLTIEVLSGEGSSAGMRIVQIRGFANRPARPEEMAIVEKWAQTHGIPISGSRW